MSRSLIIPVLALSLVLSACGGGEHEDLKRWMAESSRDLRGNVPPLPELKPFPITAYASADQPDPFSPARIEPEKADSGGKKPDFNRPKEQLENFPLESLNFIGLMTNAKDGKRRGLILVDRVMHQVSVGNYIGENFGRIVEITDSEIKLVETVQDPTGQTRDWVERESSLKLLEGGQAKEARK